MRVVPNSLFGRLVLAQVAYGVIVVVAFALIAELTHSRFHYKATQRQARDWAAQIVARHHVIAELPTFTAHDVQAIETALAHIGASNPGAAFYLVAADDGAIAAASLAREQIRTPTVDLAPVRALLEQRAALPVMIEDPVEPGMWRIFSAVRLEGREQPPAYLLMLLQGPDTRGFLAAYRSDFLVSDSLVLATGVTVPALATAVLLLFMIVRPIRRIRSTLASLERSHGPQGGDSGGGDNDRGIPELERLSRDVDAMAHKIVELLQRLQDDDRSRRELFANLSHDLRSPLTVIGACLDALATADGKLSDVPSRELIDRAATQVRFLAGLVESQFELANLQRPDYRPHPEPLFIAELVHDVVAKFIDRARKRKLELVMEGAPSEVRVLADAILIERALDNLIDNAIRHAQGATRVTIALRELAHDIEVRVSDDGIGLPPAFGDWLDGRTSALPDDVRSATSRSGLGLAIVRRIVELHGSRLVLEACGGGGVCLSFRLPRCDRQ